MQFSQIRKYFKRHQIQWNALLIVLVFIAVSIIAHIWMSYGTRHAKSCEVPNFVGCQLSDAELLSQRNGMNLIVIDSLFVPAYPGGLVLEQIPKAGSAVKSGRKVYVTINSFNQKKVRVPYVAGLSLRQAKNILQVSGLQIEYLRYIEDMATNYVLQEFAGTEPVTEQSEIMLEQGKGVILEVGANPLENSTVVPLLAGKTLFEAKNALWESGLNCGEISYDGTITETNKNSARVCVQSLFQGNHLQLGAFIALKLTVDEKKIENAVKENEQYMKSILELETQQIEETEQK